MKKKISREMVSLDNTIKRYLEASKVSFNKISCTNIWILAFIAENSDRDIFQRDIECFLSVTRSTASRVVDLMVQKGLLVKSSVSTDARLKKLTLTDKSCAIVSELKEMDDELNTTLREGIDEADLEIFYKCIDKMKSNLTRCREE